jgi:hypothetical protein
MNPETNESARPAEQARCPVCLQRLLWLDWSLVWQCEYCGWQGTAAEREIERAAQQEYEDAYYAQRREAAAGYADPAPAQASPSLAQILGSWQAAGKIEVLTLEDVAADLAAGRLSPLVTPTDLPR